MRNLKRALSLALASVMLLGMMVVGTSAASANSFTDADEISNKEAVAIATGLGIFDGYTDGSFGPKKVVTRAEMAVIITKILHGSDIDPAIFSGDSKFTDVESWAEGYVNLCDALNIVEGYSETTFGSNDPVTTVQASTMLLKALGYYTSEGDALGTDWKLEATSKASALGFYGDLSLKMDEGLTRENVAELVFNALFAQRVAFDDVRGLHVKASDRNVVVTNGTEDAYNTLAQNTYGLYKVEGTVVANGYTDANLFGDSNTVAQTEVVFAENTDVNMDGIKDGASYTFKYSTGLDMIGHAAKIYYTIEKKAPVVYAITDNAVKAELVAAGSNISAVASKAGFNRNTSEAVIVLNYAMDDVVSYATYAGTNKPMLMISNSSDLSVDYAIVLDQDLDYVTKTYVNKADPENVVTTYTMETIGAVSDAAKVVVLGDVAAEDYVIVTPVNNDADAKDVIDLYIVEKAATETEMLTIVDRTFTTTDKLSSDSESYVKSKVEVANDLVANKVVNPFDTIGTQTEDYGVTPYASVALAGEYTLIFDTFGNLIAIADPTADNSVNAAYVAQFGHKINTSPSLNDKYVLTAHVYFKDGTDGVYFVDNTEGYFDDVKVNEAGELKLNGTEWANAECVDVANKNNGVALNDIVGESYGPFIKLWDVEVDEDAKTVILNPLTIAMTDNGINKIMTTHKPNVTFMGANGADKWYGNADSVFFYVDGVYGKTGDGLTVGVVTGISNIPELKNITTAGTRNDEQADAVQVNYSQIKDSDDKVKYHTVDSMLLVGEELITSESGIYFYNEKYTITRVAADEYTLTYHMYDAATSEYAPFTYEKLFSTYAKAETEAEKYGAGYYKITSKNLDAIYSETGYVTDNKWSATTVGTKGETSYVVNTQFIDYQDYGYVVTLYTGANKDAAGVDATKATVVDLTKNNIVDLASLAATIESNQKSHDDAKTGKKVIATLAYTFKDNAVDYIYVTSVTDPATKDFGSGTPAVSNEVTKVALQKDGNAQIFMGKVANEVQMLATLYRWTDGSGWTEMAARELTIAANASYDSANACYWLGGFAEKFALSNGTYKLVVDGMASNEFVKG